MLPVLDQAAAKVKAWQACEKEDGELQPELEGAQKIAHNRALALSEAQKRAKLSQRAGHANEISWESSLFKRASEAGGKPREGADRALHNGNRDSQSKA